MPDKLTIPFDNTLNRADLICALDELNIHEGNHLEELTLKLLVDNQWHFKYFSLDIAFRVLSIKNRCAEQSQAHDRIDALFEKLFPRNPWQKGSSLTKNEALDQIARASLKPSGQLPANTFNSCDITKEEIRIEILKTCAQQDLMITIKNFLRFGIRNEKARLECAFLWAEKEPRTIARKIQLFQISDEASRFKIALLCAKKAPVATMEKIQNFHIQSEEARAQVAMICAEEAAVLLPEHFRNFDIKDASCRIRIAAICAEKNSYATSVHFMNFEIEDETDRAQLATTCAARSTKSFPKHVKNFCLNKTHRYQVAKFCAEKAPLFTAELFQNFEIEDEAIRLELLTICAHLYPESAAKHFKNFNIFSEKNRIHFVSNLAEQAPGEAAWYFDQFAITSKEARIRFALKFAEEVPASLARSIQHFEIHSEAVNIQIALICAKYAPLELLMAYHRFGIQSEETHIEIATICAKYYSYAVNYYIHQFPIQNEKARFRIAMICAENKSMDMVQYVSNFKIQNEKYRIQLATCLFKNAPEATIQAIKNSKYLSQTSFSLACILALKQNFNVLQFMDSSPIGIDLIAALFTDDPTDELLLLLSELSTQFAAQAQIAPEVKALIQRVIENAVKDSNPLSHQLMGRWLTGLLFILPLAKMGSLHSSKWFLKALSQMRDPDLRWQLTNILIDFDNAPEAHLDWEQVSKHSKWNLLTLALFPLQQQGLNLKGLLKIAHELMRLTKTKRCLFHDKIHMRIVLSTLTALANCNQLSAKEKESVLQRIFFKEDRMLNEKTILDNLAAARNIMRLDKAVSLKTQDDLQFIFEKSFEEVFSIKQKIHLESFNNQLQNDYHLSALLKYASCIKALGNPAALACFGTYVTSLLDNTFLDRRYSLNDNPHLTTVCKNHPELLLKWRSPLKYELEPSKTEINEPVFHPLKWLEMKLLDDRHVTANIDDFEKFITESPENQKLILARLGKKASALQKQVKVAPSDHLIQKQTRYKFQAICCKLSAIDPSQTQQIQRLLQSLLEVIKEHSLYRDFQRDLEELLKSENQRQQRRECYYAEVTDNPLSLLLSGTEVSGSCLHVGGYPDKNCSLLSYLMDGKIKMATIKDATGRIVARCILKILWDGSKPVLFQERMYPNLLSDAHKKILHELTRKKAEAVGLDVVSEEISGTPYLHALQSLGSPAPFEYSDGGHNRVTNGTYTILKSYLLEY